MSKPFPSWRHADTTLTAGTDRPRRSIIVRIGTTITILAVLCAVLAGIVTNRLPRLSIGSTSAGPVRGGSITYGIRGDPATMLPEGRGFNVPFVDQALWAPLWYADPQGSFHSGIASKVPSGGDISADLTTWTIHLRPDLKWSDGSPLTVDDCVFTFSLYLNPAFGSPVRVDSTTFALKLKQPYVGMLSALEGSMNTCIPKVVFGGMTAEEMASSPENGQPSVVSGPFMVKERVAGDHITVVRNPFYYQAPGKPYLDQITFKPVNQTDALSALRTHAIDAYTQIDLTQLPGYRAIPGYTTYIERYPSSYEMLMFNLKDPLLSDRDIRQAITMTIDRSAIIATILNGVGKLTCDDSVGTFAHEDDLTCYPYDPDGAGQLLDSDGWMLGTDGYRHKNGQTLELEYATTELSPRGQTQALIRDELKSIGMKIDLKVYSGAEFFGDAGPVPIGVLAEGHFQIAEAGDGGWLDPDDDNFIGSDAFPEVGGGNFMRYVNAQVDTQERVQETTADITARKAAFHIIHADVIKDLPVMYLYAPQNVSCARSDLRNFDRSIEGAVATSNVWDWWLAPKGSA